MSRRFCVRHVTRFRYTSPIRESVMEVRKCPLSEGIQECLSFDLRVSPAATARHYKDHLGNTVHHFNIPQAHQELTVVAESRVFLADPPLLPDRLESAAWDEVDRFRADHSLWEFLSPSRFARPTPPLEDLAREVGAERRDDPLTVLRDVNNRLYEAFEYTPSSTRVDSPIDEALESRAGVCQDFAHIMIAMVRGLGIPCRYVSGYLFHAGDNHDRSEEDASHAWVEAYLPGMGWLGFDPTNDIVVQDRHIRAAVGRDYADVPPTRGVYKGDAQHDLSVAVQVRPSGEPMARDDFRVMSTGAVEEEEVRSPFLDCQPQQ